MIDNSRSFHPYSRMKGYISTKEAVNGCAL
jgi:hypothetical protein